MSFSGEIGTAKIRIVPEIDEAAFRRARQQSQAALGGAAAGRTGGAAGTAAVAGATGASVTRLNRDAGALNKTTGELDKSLAKMRASMGAGAVGAGLLSKAIGPLVGAAGIGFLGATIAGTARESIRFADELGKTASRIGVSVEALQEYRFAAQQAGISTQTVELAVQRFGRRAGELATFGRGELKPAFEAFGLSVTDAGGRLKTVDELLPEFLRKLAEVEDPIQRNALAMKAFDTEGVAMVNLVRDGADAFDVMRARARELGLVLSGDVVAAAERTESAMGALADVFDKRLKAAVLGSADQLDGMTSILEDPETLEAVGRLADAIGGLSREIVGLGVDALKAIKALDDFGAKIDDKLADFRQFIRETTGIGGVDPRVQRRREQERAEQAALLREGLGFGRVDPRVTPPDTDTDTDRPPPPGPVDTSAADTARQQIEQALALRIQAERELTLVGLSEADRRRAILDAELEDALRAVEDNADAQLIIRGAFRERALALDAELDLARQQAAGRLGDEIRDNAALLDVLSLPRGAGRDAAEAALDFERSIRGVREQADALRRQGLIDEETIRAWEEGAARIEEARLAERLTAPIVELRKEIARTFGQDLLSALREGELGFDTFANAAQKALDRVAAVAFDTFIDQTFGGSGTGGPLDSLLGAALGLPGATGGPRGAPGGAARTPGIAGGGGATQVSDPAVAEATAAVQAAVLGENVPAIGRVEQAINAMAADGAACCAQGATGDDVGRLQQENRGGFDQVAGAVYETGAATQQAILATGATAAAQAGAAIAAQNEGNIISAVVGFAGGLEGLGGPNDKPLATRGNLKPGQLTPGLASVLFPPGEWTQLANGGPFEAGQRLLVGEAGPELAVFDQPGQIVPNGAMMGGGIHVTVVASDADSFRRDDSAALRDLGRQINGLLGRG